ncbi:hypothetical protein MMC16_006308 [Acarospora aff. strigata]|nr:hypothetical protein [Acarospora aff. strigata]
MKSKRILSVLLPLLSSVNVGLTSPVAISLPRHSKPELLGDTSWVPLQYIGPIHPGGSDITLNGTAQELHSQILHLNPDFQISDFAEPEPEEPSTTTTPHLRARNPLAPWCNPPGIGTTSGYATLSNINYLRDLPGRCYVAEGPRTCARIACWHGAAVFVCNDVSAPAIQFNFDLAFEREGRQDK